MKKHPAFQFVLIFAAIVAVFSCADAAQRRVAFNEANFARTRGAGSGLVVGRAFTILRDGTTKFAQNVEVDLVPINPYTTEIMKRRFDGGEDLGPADPRYFKYVRSAQTDDRGNFVIHHIPPGNYYVGTEVSWRSDWFWNTDNFGISTKSTVERSQHIYAQVSIKNGQTVRIIGWNQGK
jgi:hypothetical protein